MSTFENPDRSARQEYPYGMTHVTEHLLADTAPVQGSDRRPFPASRFDYPDFVLPHLAITDSHDSPATLTETVNDVTNKFDAKTGNVISRVQIRDGVTTRDLYDPATQAHISNDYTNAQYGYRTHTQFDKTSGRPVSWDVTYADGSGEHDLLNPNDSHAVQSDYLSIDRRDYHGNTERVVYNPATGKVQSDDFKFANGSSEHHYQYQYDKDGGQTSERVQYSDGRTALVRFVTQSNDWRNDGHIGASVNRMAAHDARLGLPGVSIDTETNSAARQHDRYDPRTAKLASREIDEANGTSTSIKYDSSTREDAPMLALIRHPDGSQARVDWDPFTHKEQSIALTDAHGHIQSYNLDSASGNWHKTTLLELLTDISKPAATMLFDTVGAAYGISTADIRPISK